MLYVVQYTMCQTVLTAVQQVRAHVSDIARDLYPHMNLPSVLMHNDCWSNNLLFKADNNGEASGTLLAFIDWQVRI
jgi:Ser/Thr protein kinase RdoA (MazF antagonist)